ncbi:hypothetical protein BofuT4_P032090.1 [Botrytis cinerea T4]|uniref:N-acetyltransferase domain-containing protein n=1 Tax=Botryotinia fuckeliana (strain T4) TaxID=999810 RepID=G2Y9Q7_BOTF4|nr:hypothetical protein BofuT4_P032090.1 [Botrytis cinerea T4]
MSSPISSPILSLAEIRDARELAAITTSAFEVSDTIYPITWGNTDPGAHDTAVMLLFNPMQSETIVTWKVEIDGKIVGYARWSLPEICKVTEGNAVGKNGEDDKSASAQHKKKVEEGWKTPDGNLLLQWGLSTADKEGRKIYLVSTPQARVFYEKSGWLVKENLAINLEVYGGRGIYQRSWMIREARDKEGL